MSLNEQKLKARIKENELAVKLEELKLKESKKQSDYDLRVAQLEAKISESRAVCGILQELLNGDPTEFQYKAIVANSVIRKEKTDVKALEEAAQHLEYKHVQERLAIESRKQEDFHQEEIKCHEVKAQKVENVHIAKMEQLLLEKEKIKFHHELRMARFEEKKDETKAVGEILKQLSDFDVTEFAYKAIVAESVIRNEDVDVQALDVAAKYHRMREESRHAIAQRYSEENEHSTKRIGWRVSRKDEHS